ncbi:MAG: hypothetical protein LBS34_01150 [Rickettsiales bacterium]|nr:hypothetical protein [Rickettsiales bacterium]
MRGYAEITDYMLYRRVSERRWVNSVVYVLKLVVVLVYIPLLLLFLLLNIQLFAKVMKQVVVIMYSIFLIMAAYTLLNQNKKIGDGEQVVIDLNYRHKIRDFR